MCMFVCLFVSFLLCSLWMEKTKENFPHVRTAIIILCKEWKHTFMTAKLQKCFNYVLVRYGENYRVAFVLCESV